MRICDSDYSEQGGPCMSNFKKTMVKEVLLLFSLVMIFVCMSMQAFALEDVTGTWTVVFKQGLQTTMTLQQSGSSITGTLETPDGTRKQVVGKLEGKTLTLSRDTGLETVQHYQVTVSGNQFNGTYRNVGKYPDQGEFTGIKR